VADHDDQRRIYLIAVLLRVPDSWQGRIIRLGMHHVEPLHVPSLEGASN
jgi:hypothetical protein